MLTSFDLIDFDVKSSSNLTHISRKRDIGPTTKGTLKVSFHNLIVRNKSIKYRKL